jgi:tetratricopeptide (TPR) repeat protein
LDELEDMCRVNLIAVKSLDDTEHATDITASTLSHLAQMYESLGSADKAVKLNQEGLELRLREVPLKLHLICGFENNLGCAYNTANDHVAALAILEKSLDTWNRALEQEGKPPAREPVITANIGRCLFYLGKMADARQHVDLAIEEFKKTKPINWGGLA